MNRQLTQPVGRPALVALTLLVVLLLFALVPGNLSARTTAVQTQPARLIRFFNNEEMGLTSPAGLTYSAASNAFQVLDQTSANKANVDVVSIKLSGRRGGSARIAATIKDPLNTAFDPVSGKFYILKPESEQLAEVASNPDGTLNPQSLVFHKLKDLNLGQAEGMTVDTAAGHLLFLDGANGRIVRVAPAGRGNFKDVTITAVTLQAPNLTRPQGIAYHPATGALYVLDQASATLYAFAPDGQAIASHPVPDITPGARQGLVFAPSGDSTDDPDILSLYMVDTGGAGDGLLSAAAPTNQPGQIAELSLMAAAALDESVETETAVLIGSPRDLSSLNPPIPDAAGLAYLVSPGSGNLMISDSEVDEYLDPSINQGVNLFEVVRTGANVTSSLSTTTFNDEATGIAFDPDGSHALYGGTFFITSDENPRGVFEYDPDAVTNAYFTPDPDGDPGGVAYLDGTPAARRVFVVDGLSSEVYTIDPGPDHEFGVPYEADNTITQFDIASLGINDAEGIEYNPDNGHLYILARLGNVIAETTLDGTLQRYISIDIRPTYPAISSPSGLTFAPASDGGGDQHLYVVSRGADGTSDSQLYEFSLDFNVAPIVDAGDDQVLAATGLATLNATVSDEDGMPDPPGSVTTTWSQVSGPATAVFTNPSAVDTTVDLPQMGIYTLRLEADDGGKINRDEITMTVLGPNDTIALNVPVSHWNDDAIQQGPDSTSSPDSVNVNDPNLEMTYFKGDHQLVGMRFFDLDIPPGAAIQSAYIQFTSEAVDTGAITLTIEGEAEDDAPRFTATNFNISDRARTAASVTWNPSPWATTEQAGIAQQTPDLTTIMQEIVDRPGWARGNAMVFIVTSDTTQQAHRVAYSYNGNPAKAPVLHLTYKLEAPDITVQPASSDLDILWTHLYPFADYELWHSTTPYFSPGDSGTTKLADVPAPSAEDPLSETDTGAFDDTTNHYYMIRASVSALTFDSNQAGKFRFPIVPGE